MGNEGSGSSSKSSSSKGRLQEDYERGLVQIGEWSPQQQ